MPPLRDASELLYPAVQEAIATLGLLGSDAAAVKLAQQYAKVIDSQNGHCPGCTSTECRRSQGSAWAMRWLAPELLRVLETLGATPQARKALEKGQQAQKPAESGLTRLRSAK